MNNEHRVHVSYGPWERADDEISPVIGPSYGFGGRFLGMRLYHSHRRKRYETWIENGQKMGRWTWEFMRPAADEDAVEVDA